MYPLKQDDLVLSLCNQLQVITKDVEDQQIQASLETLRASMNNTYKILVIGPTNVGKSTVINHLIGETICQTAHLPNTIHVHEIKYGASSVEVTIDLYTKRQFSTNSVLQDMMVIDTPGLESIDEDIHQRIQAHLRSTRLLVVVLSPLNVQNVTVWKKIIHQIEGYDQEVLLVVNQADRLSIEERTTIAQWVESNLASLGKHVSWQYCSVTSTDVDAFKTYMKAFLDQHNQQMTLKDQQAKHLLNLFSSIKIHTENYALQAQTDHAVLVQMDALIDDFRQKNEAKIKKIQNDLFQAINAIIDDYRNDIISNLDVDRIEKLYPNYEIFHMMLMTKIEHYKEKMDLAMENQIQKYIRPYMTELNWLIDDLDQQLEKRQNHVDIEEQLYGMLATRKTHFVADTKDALQEVSRHNQSLYEASNDLFLTLWQAKHDFINQKKALRVGMGAVGGIAGVAVVAAKMGVGAAAFLPLVLGLVVGAAFFYSIGRALGNPIFEKGLYAKANASIEQFKGLIETSKLELKSNLDTRIEAVFGNEITNIEILIDDFKAITVKEHEWMLEKHQAIHQMMHEIGLLEAIYEH